MDRRDEKKRRKDDQEHLRLLAIFHFILAGLCALFGFFPVIHLVMGIAMVTGAFGSSKGSQPPPPALGWMFIGIAASIMVFYWALAICLALAGRQLQRRRGYLFCLVTAGFACLFTPLGTVLGVFTIIVLLRPTVKELFNDTRRSEIPDNSTPINVLPASEDSGQFREEHNP